MCTPSLSSAMVRLKAQLSTSRVLKLDKHGNLPILVAIVSNESLSPSAAIRVANRLTRLHEVLSIPDRTSAHEYGSTIVVFNGGDKVRSWAVLSSLPVGCRHRAER